MKVGNLYFVQVDGGGVIKIGWTQGHVLSRIRQLQWASPEILNWIGACPAPREAEKAAHKELARHRHRGEWFHPSDEVVQFIKSRVGDFCPDEYARKHYRTDLIERYRKLTNHKDKARGRLLELAGIGRYDVHGWVSHTRMLPPPVLGRMEAAIRQVEFEQRGAA